MKHYALVHKYDIFCTVYLFTSNLSLVEVQCKSQQVAEKLGIAVYEESSIDIEIVNPNFTCLEI